MQAALKAFETWKLASVEERTNLLFRVSALLRERKFELMAWLVFEVGKNWPEADGDIAELDRNGGVRTMMATIVPIVPAKSRSCDMMTPRISRKLSADNPSPAIR